MRDDRLRLSDVAAAITSIERYTVGGREAFDSDELVQTWILWHLQVIGEASRYVSEEIRAAHPEVEWAGAIALRNVIAHHYFGIKWDAIWSVIENRLPPLKSAITAILAELDAAETPPPPTP